MRMIELGEATLSPPDVSNFESIVQELMGVNSESMSA